MSTCFVLTCISKSPSSCYLFCLSFAIVRSYSIDLIKPFCISNRASQNYQYSEFIHQGIFSNGMKCIKISHDFEGKAFQRQRASMDLADLMMSIVLYIICVHDCSINSEQAVQGNQLCHRSYILRIMR